MRPVRGKERLLGALVKPERPRVPLGEDGRLQSQGRPKSRLLVSLRWGTLRVRLSGRRRRPLSRVAARGDTRGGPSLAVRMGTAEKGCARKGHALTGDALRGRALRGHALRGHAPRKDASLLARRVGSADEALGWRTYLQ